MHHSWVLNDWGKSGFGNLASILSARNVKKKKKKKGPKKVRRINKTKQNTKKHHM